MSNQKLVEGIQFVIEKDDACEKTVAYTVPKEVLKAEQQKLAKEWATQVSIPGFRKGKVPTALILKRYADNIEEEMVSKCFEAAIEKKVFGDRRILTYDLVNKEKPHIDFDADFKFEFEFELFPEFEIPNYEGLKIEAPAADDVEKIVEERIKSFRETYSEFIDIEGPAEAKDLLKVDYSSDFELPEDASATLKRQTNVEDGWIFLEEPENIPNSIKSLMGAKVGEEYTFDATYGEDYKEEALAGKTLKYTVKVKGIQRQSPLNDDKKLCERLQVEDMDKLKEVLTETASQEVKSKQEKEIEEALIEKVVDSVGDFPLPTRTLENEIISQVNIKAREVVKTDEDAEAFKKDIDKHKEDVKEEAIKALRRTLILSKIAEEKELNVSQDELAEHIGKLSRYYGMTPEELYKRIQENNGLEELHMSILFEKIGKMLRESADISGL